MREKMPVDGCAPKRKTPTRIVHAHWDIWTLLHVWKKKKKILPCTRAPDTTDTCTVLFLQ